MSVPRTTVEQRKAMPLASGVLDYFPDALLVVAEVSRIGNEQHHPGEPLHWDKSKSQDEADALLRHLLDRGTIDTDGLRHSGKVAWRALAMLQRELDAEAIAIAQPMPVVREGTMMSDGLTPSSHDTLPPSSILHPAFDVSSELAVCEDSGNHIPGRHLLFCPDFC